MGKDTRNQVTHRLKWLYWNYVDFLRSCYKRGPNFLVRVILLQSLNIVSDPNLRESKYCTARPCRNTIGIRYIWVGGPINDRKIKFLVLYHWSRVSALCSRLLFSVVCWNVLLRSPGFDYPTDRMLPHHCLPACSPPHSYFLLLRKVTPSVISLLCLTFLITSRNPVSLHLTTVSLLSSLHARDLYNCIRPLTRPVNIPEVLWAIMFIRLLHYKCTNIQINVTLSWAFLCPIY